MARYQFQGIFHDGNGKVVSDGTISVYLAGTTTVASVYEASSGGTAVNSVTSDSSGVFSFWVDDSDYGITQLFKLVLSMTNFETKTYDNIFVTAETSSLIDLTSVQTFTNKTLTTPIIASIYQDAGKTNLVTIPATTDTLVGKNTTDTLTNKTLTTPVIASFYQDAAKAKLMTTPDTASDTLVAIAATQTLTNKTLTSPVVASVYQDAGKTKLMTVPDTASDTLCAIAATQTLTNKTLTTPIVASMYQDAGKTKLMTVPNTASDTLTANAATQTLTNKTLTSPALTTPLINDGDTGLSITSANQTHAAPTATIPDIGDAADTFVMADTTQTLTNKTITLSGYLNEAYATVASHATTAPIWVALGNLINYTGVEVATAFPNAPQAGAKRTLICAAACGFTAGANMLINGIASAATYTAAAGDRVEVEALSTTQVKLTITKYDGTAVVASGSTAASQAEMEAATDDTKSVTPVKVKYSPSAAKAWVNFNGTGTVAIRSSMNVSSITDEGTASYTVNLTNAMSDANYCIVGSLSTPGANLPHVFVPNVVNDTEYAPTTTTFRIGALEPTIGWADAKYVHAVIYGDQ